MDAVDVVKKVYACYEKGDLDGVAELCTPDTVWTTRSNIPAGSVPWIGTHRGPEAVKTNFLGAMGMATNLDSESLTLRSCRNRTRVTHSQCTLKNVQESLGHIC